MLFVSMREILRLGGFVARGGPYEIAYPAPDWAWAIPVCIMAGFAFGILNIVAAPRARGFTLVLPAWAALFIALGWNFLEFGVHPPGDVQDTWVWIACGVLFWAMGLPAAVAIIAGWSPSQLPGGAQAGAWAQPVRARASYVVLNLVSIAVGIVAGVTLFGALAG
jgi:hypothetical protein